MNDLDVDPQFLEQLLHERVDDLHPDLGARAARAIRVGTRIRRRRRVGAGLGAVAGVAAVSAIGYQVLPGGGTATAPSVQGFAAGPSVTASATATGHPSPSAKAHPSPTRTPPVEQLPVTLVAPGWHCGPPADEKFICTSGGASAVVIVRPANEHQAYTSDPDKAAPGQYVSAVHRGFFATIVGGPNTTATTVQQLGQYLVWS
ncbi:MAG: hypothetical protein ACRDPB_09635 [Nocardioidaceae bacterium]